MLAASVCPSQAGHTPALPDLSTEQANPGPEVQSVQGADCRDCAPGDTDPGAGQAQPVRPVIETRRSCPRCGGRQVALHGGFRMASGRRVQRYLCRTCRRTFSSNTGTPSYRIRKQENWFAMVELLAENLSLRQVASRLGISLSTAFRWRHRALAVLAAQPRAQLEGDVSVDVFLVKYSEKGSRICNGPGSWGYWNLLRRGLADGGSRSCAGGGRNRFRLFIDGRPLNVMVAETDGGYELEILGQGRRTPDMVGQGLSRLVKPGSRVFAFGGNEYRQACELLGYTHHDGVAAIALQAKSAAPASSGGNQNGGEARRVYPTRSPNLPTWWLRQFRGVATRYLHHYLAWFRHIVRIVQYPDGQSLALADGRAWLRRSAC